MITTANRLHTVEEYYFSRKLKQVNTMIAEGKPVINLGIGSPDLAPPPEVVKVLKESLFAETAHKYQSYAGLPELRKAMASFYKTRFNVEVSPENEVLPLMGSKEGIMHISMAYLNKGDQVLVPNPGYPTYTSVTKLLEAQPVLYDLNEADNWLPDLKALKKQDLSKVKLMWLNYPHMPTGFKATEQFFKNVVAFAKQHEILVINDNPYSFVLNNEPLSILSVEGAKEVCIELNSLSKTFNMAGWRVGMIMGKPEFIQSILQVKSNMDSGMFYGIQKGAIEALKSPDQWFSNLNALYTGRRKLVCQLADAMGCTYTKETVGMFVWAKLPQGKTSEKYIDRLLEKKHVFIAPGTIFGTKGEGFVRLSLCASSEKIKQAIERVSDKKENEQ